MKSTFFVFFLSVVTLFLPSCAQVPVQFDGESGVMFADPVAFDDLEVSETFGDFGLADVIEFDEDELGVQLRYLSKASAEHYVDVYVYPMYQSEMVSLADALEFEQYHLNAEIDNSWDEPHGQPNALIQTYRPRNQDVSAGGLLSVRTVAREGIDYQTHSFLTIRNDAILKVRMSVEVADELPIESFQEVVDGAYEAINFRDRVPKDLGTVVTATTVVEVADSQSCALGAWLMYGVKLTALLKEQQFLNTLERETMARKAAIDFWDAKEEKPDGPPCDYRYMDQLSLVSANGFLSEHVFHQYGRPYWRVTDELRIREYLEWARVNLSGYDPIHFPGIFVKWQKPE